MLGEPLNIRKSHFVNSWQTTCIQSNQKDQFGPCKSHSYNNGNLLAGAAPAHIYR
jgi:hypothetical protein